MSVCYALPVITSIDDQNYAQNISSTQINEITITDDAVDPKIKSSSGIRIHIPTGMPAIFDSTRTINELVVFGTAVDNGKVSKTPKILFEDKDKTLFIPVVADFSAGEILHVRYLSLEGFHSATSESQYLELMYDASATSVKDKKYITVYSSSNSDSNAPENVKNFILTQTSDSEIKLTWEDPTDLDLQTLSLFRSVNGSTIDANMPYKKIFPGVQLYTDTGLNIGDTVKYQIRGEDGLNYGTVVENPLYTMIKYVPPVIENEVITPITEPTSTDTPTSPTDEVITESKEVVLSDSNEIQTMYPWAKDPIHALITKGIITIPSNGNFRPGDSLNRGESSSLFCRLLGIDEKLIAGESPFLDISKESPYAYCLGQLKSKSIVNGINGLFKPENSISRSEFLALTLRSLPDYDQSVLAKTPVQSFYDINIKTDWYANIAEISKEKGLVVGKNCGKNGDKKCFDGMSAITRAEAATILYRAFANVLN